MKLTKEEILLNCFLGVIDFNEAAALAAMEKYAKQQVRAVKKKKSCSNFVQSIAKEAEYIDGSHYKYKYRNKALPVIEYNELIELAAKYDKK